MGAVREPTLYKCAVGNVGVYELPLFYEEDARVRKSQTTYLGEWIGERAAIAAISPTRMADRIRIPVLLAAGEEDEVAPVKHTRLMEKALKAAGVPVESIYFDSEGHGYYLEESRRTYFSRLLAFLERHIGGAGAGAPGAATAK
jgi:dipeptidyl aminopeptidase/acylaminoacyl peptidase